MRRPRRRRPAGLPQAPPTLDHRIPVPPVRPRAVPLTLGPGRTLLGLPDTGLGTVAHVWYDTTPSRRPVRVEWPIDPGVQAPIAPLDLHVGHVLEFAPDRSSANTLCTYAVVIHVTRDEVMVIEYEYLGAAVSVAVQVVELWRRGPTAPRVAPRADA